MVRDEDEALDEGAAPADAGARLRAVPGDPDGAVPDPAAPADAADEAVGAPTAVMDLLAEHVPLALLADLVAPGGPESSEILAAEGLPDDAWWEDDDDPAPASDDSDAPGTDHG